jgi:hypothetical protein
MSDDKAEGARNEVKRLLSAGVIREVTYPEWLANTVMVKKAIGKWRMCIDFTDLNKSMLKGRIPITKNRLPCRCSSFFGAHESTGLLFRLSSNMDEEGR